jgi:DNA replication initiation complex subunit (GINS family)
MITYNDIYETARKERYSDQLQPLSKNFVEEVAVYLKEKREMSSKEEGLFSDVVVKTKKQLENATTLFNELMLRRRKKILNLVLIF